MTEEDLELRITLDHPREDDLEEDTFNHSQTGNTVAEEFGVPYGNRTRVTAVKEKGPIVIQRNLAAWIALYRI